MTATESEQPVQVGDMKTIYRVVKKWSSNIKSWQQHFKAFLNCPVPQNAHNFNEGKYPTIDVDMDWTQSQKQK